ncbi:RNA binding motif protein X-linked 2 L homeolog [Xenopus laevis]|uniref:RNA-binding motif protein, X-linked 2 n=1 Tax=Xenopus laevis TaxID=8355 RepID=Q6PGS9_XENLA|nr:RNA binding motif protein X-linked 2 L homeolog [Xenopus laevis]AAH56844.1 MGC64376 protein [Xenopus laevis]
MNPLTKVKLINELNAREASLGVKDSVSWHQDYKDSAWIFIGGLPFELTEGDVICVFSQYGEVVNINLARDKSSGRSRGFCFVCFEDQRSTVLAVDNLNGIKLKGRTIRVDHVANYRPPKDAEDIDEITQTLREKGCAARTPSPTSSSQDEEEEPPRKKKDKKKKKDKSRRKEGESSNSTTKYIKQEPVDSAYDRARTTEKVSKVAPENSRALEEDRGSRKRSNSKGASQDKHKEQHRQKEKYKECEQQMPRDRYREQQEQRSKGRTERGRRV